MRDQESVRSDSRCSGINDFRSSVNARFSRFLISFANYLVTLFFIDLRTSNRMNKHYGILMLVFTISLAMFACQPYEDGPNISFKSKKVRITKSWMPQFVFNTETERDVTEDYDNYSIDIKLDGSFEAKSKDLNDSIWIQHGLWDLVNDDLEIRLLYTEPVVNPDRDFFTILRLKDDELWFTRSEGDTLELEYRMIPGDLATQ